MQVLLSNEIQNNISDLLNEQSKYAISIYLKTHEIWDQNEKVKIRLKKKINKIQNELEDTNTYDSKSKELLNTLRELENNEEIWKKAQKGLAIFISPNLFKIFILSRKVPDKVYLSSFFNIKFLAPFIFEREDYYILAISASNTLLYKGENKYIELMKEKTKNLPENLEAVLAPREGEKSMQHHMAKPVGRSTQNGAAYHGHGAYPKEREIQYKRYTEEIETAVDKVINNKNIPLILITTDTFASYYEKINAYPNMLKEYIPGNIDNKKTRHKLLKKCWPIIKQDLTEQKIEIINAYKALEQQRTTDINEVLKHSYFGKTEYLLIKENKDIWGEFDPKDMTIKKHENKLKDSKDLLNLSVIFTIKHEGKIYQVPKEKELKSDAAALLRY